MELSPNAHSPPQKETFANTSKTLLENRSWTFPAVCYFTWILEFFSNILSVAAVAHKPVAYKKISVLIIDFQL